MNTFASLTLGEKHTIMNSLDVRNPYSDEIITTLNFHSDAEITSFITEAYHVFKNENLAKTQRISILKKFALLVESNSELLLKTAISEGGKPFVDTQVEIQRAINGIELAIHTLYHFKGEEIPMGLNTASENRRAYTLLEPLGVCLGISAYNHPINLIIHQVIPAIATGCPVLIKPSLKTPLSCKILVDLLYEAGLPKPWCQFVLCKNEQIECLISDKRIRYVSFIGSSNIGWQLRSKLASGTHIALEHGGAAPVIVHEDVDLEPAVKALVKASFYHAGQVCVSAQRIYVHENILEKFLSFFISETKKLKTGNPSDTTTDVGPLITKEELSRVDTWVKEACKNGAELLAGGQKIGETCYEPSVLFEPKESDKISTEEIFGPVVAIYAYTDIQIALNKANQLPFAFQAAIFTKNIDLAFYCIQKLEAKTVLVNEHPAFRVDWMPFGGDQDSGIGIGGIPYTMREMSREKLVVFKNNFSSI